MHERWARVVTSVAVAGSLFALVDCRAPTPEAAHRPKRARVESREVIVLQAGGDVAYPFGRAPSPDWEAQGPALFGDLAPLLRQGDLSFANIEGPFSHHGKSDPANHILVSDPHRLAWVTAAGFNLFSVANNHSLDAGLEGLHDTVNALKKLGDGRRCCFVAGAADSDEEATRPVHVTLPGKRTPIAFFAMTWPHFKNVDWGRMAAERIHAAATNGDIVVVSIHEGREFSHVPSAEIATQYRSYIDAGARVVLGHHPHVAQGVERYRDGIIFYSLGNLSFGVSPDRERTRGIVECGLFARVTLADGEIADARAFTLYTSNVEPLRAEGESLPPRFARPQLLSGPFAKEANERLRRWSEAIPAVARADYHVEGDALVVGPSKQ